MILKLNVVALPVSGLQLSLLSGEGELQRLHRITILGEAVIFAEGGDCVTQGEAAVGLHAHGALGQVLSP